MEKSRTLSNTNGVTLKVHRSWSWRSSYRPKLGRFENWKSSDCYWMKHNESLKIQNKIWKVKWEKKYFYQMKQLQTEHKELNIYPAFGEEL